MHDVLELDLESVATIESAEAVYQQIAELVDELSEREDQRAEEFATDVMDRADGILSSIHQMQRVTEKQQAALVNMREGLRKWVERGQ